MLTVLVKPLLKKYRKLFISMVFVSSLGITIMSGLSSAYTTLDYSLNNYVDNYKYADIVITTKETDATFVEEVKEIKGVFSADKRLVADVPVILKSGKQLSMRALSYGIRDFQDFYIWEEMEVEDYPNVALEYKFARENNISAGDIIEFRNDSEFIEAAVGLIISSPECLSVQRNGYSWGENKDFSYIYIPEDLAYGTELYNSANQFVIKVEKWGNIEEVLEKTEKLCADKDIEVLSSFGYDESPVKKKIDINLKPIKTLSIFVPCVFFASMIAVVSLFLSQIVNQCRKDIGILRALGFEKKQIRLLFSLISLIISSIASVLGLVLGNGLLMYVSRMYADFFPLPHIDYLINYKMILIAIAATIISGQISSFVSTSQIAHIMPSEAMSRITPKSSKIPVIYTKVINKLSVELKYGFSSIFKNRKRFYFSMICVSFSLAMIFSSISFDYSKDSILEEIYDLRTHYDAEIFFDSKPSSVIINDIKNIEGVKAVEKLDYLRADLIFNNKSEAITICAIENNSSLVDIVNITDGNNNLGYKEIIIEKHTAEELGICAGDNIFIDGVSLKVSGISDQSVNRMNYVSVETIEKCLTVDQYTLICQSDDNDLLLEYAKEIDSYLYTDFTELMKEGNLETFKTYSMGVYILIGFAVVLGFLIVYNTMQTNLFEQKRELSVLRSLGFQISQISNIWFVQTFLQFILSCVIGVPLGRIFAGYALANMATEGREYPLSDNIYQYLIAILIVFIYTLISHYLSINSIRKWDIVENVKDRE